MATLIPSLNSCLSRMTSGEKRMAEALEHHLEDNYLLWYDVPIGSKQLHPDFIILHRERGLFILEVKDWKLEHIQTLTRTSVTLLTPDGVKEVCRLKCSRGRFTILQQAAASKKVSGGDCHQF